MNFLTDEKLVIVGASGMIGSNMLQLAFMMRLSSNICAYDSYGPGLEGAVEEMYHCEFPNMNLSYTTDVKEAFTGAKYILSSGGATRTAGMTREDLLKGNSEIAAQLGKDIRSYCPDVKHVVIIFNPVDITGLVTLIHSGLKPNQLSTLAALDSTRLQTALAQHFGVSMSDIERARTYGGHGEMMAVFASPAKVQGIPLIDLIGTDKLSYDEWAAIKKKVSQWGKRIIELRGRSSFQSPSYISMLMIAAAMGGATFTFPAGLYVNNDRFQHVVMALESHIDSDGITMVETVGTEEEMAELDKSAEHLKHLIDDVIVMGIIPPIEEWGTLNKYL